MKIFYRFSFLILCLSLLTSCSPHEKKVKDNSRFFDLKTYFADQIALLEKENVPVSKTIVNNGKMETVHIQNVIWENELRAFMEIDITLPAHILSYSIDSMVSGNLTTYQYHARDSTPLIRDIIIKTNNGIPDTIYIRKVISNSYTYSEEIMRYFGNGNYELQVINEPQIGKKIAFELKGVAGKLSIN